jgi:hypothetical protein
LITNSSSSEERQRTKPWVRIKYLPFLFFIKFRFFSRRYMNRIFIRLLPLQILIQVIIYPIVRH